MSPLELASRVLSECLSRRRPTAVDPDVRSQYHSCGILTSIKEQLLPAVEDLWHRPSFRTLVTQPFVRLLPEVDSPERVLMDSLKKTFQSAASELKQFLLSEAKWVQISIPISFQAIKRLCPRYSRELLTIAYLRNRIETATKDTQTEWAYAEDYFGATRDTAIKTKDGHLQRGEFIVAFNRNLTYAGNSIARCMLVRASLPNIALAEVAAVIRAIAIHNNRPIASPWETDIKMAERQLDDLRRASLTSPEAALVESAIVLLQVFAAFRETADLKWLNVPTFAIRDHLHRLRHRVDSACDFAVADQVAAAVSRIASHYKRMPAHQTALDDAVATGGLVVDLASRTVFWKYKMLNTDWFRYDRPWSLLLKLAQSYGRSCVTANDLYENVVGRSTLATTFNRLKPLLPADLRKHLLSVRGKQQYRIDLPAAQITVIEPENPALELLESIRNRNSHGDRETVNNARRNLLSC